MAEKGRLDHRMNFWWMLNSVTIHALDKGQILAIGLFGLAALGIAKMPGPDWAKTVDRLINGVAAWQGVMYVLAVGALILPTALALWVVGEKNREISRISHEKKELQELAHGRAMKSSQR